VACDDDTDISARLYSKFHIYGVSRLLVHIGDSSLNEKRLLQKSNFQVGKTNLSIPHELSKRFGYVEN